MHIQVSIPGWQNSWQKSPTSTFRQSCGCIYGYLAKSIFCVLFAPNSRIWCTIWKIFLRGVAISCSSVKQKNQSWCTPMKLIHFPPHNPHTASPMGISIVILTSGCIIHRFCPTYYVHLACVDTHSFIANWLVCSSSTKGKCSDLHTVLPQVVEMATWLRFANALHAYQLTNSVKGDLHPAIGDTCLYQWANNERLGCRRKSSMTPTWVH